MPYRCLADFLEELARAGELVRIPTPVDPALEAAEITARVAVGGGPALLLGSVAGYNIPVLTNLLGADARICRALGGTSPDSVAERVAALLHSPPPDRWFQRLASPFNAASLGGLRPQRIKTGPCQQIARLGSDVDLGELPALQSAPAEPGRTLTAAALFSVDPESRVQIAGRYDLHLLDPDRLAACWAPYDEHAALLAEYRRRGARMPLAAVLGGDPALLLAAMAQPAPQTETMALAGLLRGKALETVAGRSVELAVPAEAEIVIEGYVDPAEPPAVAGPLCTAMGRYSAPRPAPVMHVTAITHRANPICPAMVPSAPPNEQCMVERALQRVFLPLVKLAIPELIDYDLPLAAAARHWAALAIRKTYAGQAHRVAHAAWGLRQLMFAKVLVVVDDEIDVHDHQQVLAAIAANASPGRDVVFQQGPPDPFDPAPAAGAMGQRMAIDATSKLPEEHAGSCLRRVAMSESVCRLVSERWAQYGLAR